MSLETLLEAAEFLESSGKDLEHKTQRPRFDRRNSFVWEDSNNKDDNDNCPDVDDATFKEPKEKIRSGKMPDFTGGNTDGFVMRAGTREVHNKLEKNRRAHLKECFDFLKKNIPSLEDKRTSNLGILRSSLRYIQNLKRREREFELEMQRFAHEKILLQNHMQNLKNDLNSLDIEVDLNVWTTTQEHDNETNSTSTATERGTPPPSDHDEQDDDEEEAEKLVMENNPSPTPKLNQKKGAKDNSHKHSNHHKISPNSNGLVSRPHLSSALKSPSKKTIPITLSLMGPVKQGHSTFKMPQVGVMNNPSGKLSEIPLSRLPVTQILHRTLTQRQALMKQAAMSQVSSAPLTAAQLKSPPMTRPTAPVSEVSQFLPSTVSTHLKFGSLQLLPSAGPSTQTSRTSTTGSVAILDNTQSVPGVGVAAGTLPLSLPYYMASMQKISHPILVTSLMAPAIGLTSTSSPLSSSTAGTSSITMATNLTSSGIPIKSEPRGSVQSGVAMTTTSAVNYITTPILSPAITQTSAGATTNFPIRPMFAPNLIAGQVAWPFLTVPRTSLLPTTSVSSTTPISTNFQSNSTQVTTVPIMSLAQLNQSNSTQVTTVPIMSLAQLNQSNSTQVTTVPIMSLAQLNQLTQMMSPVTVMSPNLQMTPSQLSNMMASPFLKQFQFPLGIPSSLLPTGQVLGQQEVKPVVVVTVPNIVSQSSAISAVPSSASVVTSSI